MGESKIKLRKKSVIRKKKRKRKKKMEKGEKNNKKQDGGRTYHIADVRTLDQTGGHHPNIVLHLKGEGVVFLVATLHVVQEVKVNSHVSRHNRRDHNVPEGLELGLPKRVQEVELGAHQNTEGGGRVKVLKHSLVVVQKGQGGPRVDLVKVVQPRVCQVMAQRRHRQAHHLNMLQVVKHCRGDQQVVERLQHVHSVAEVVVGVVAIVRPHGQQEAVEAVCRSPRKKKKGKKRKEKKKN